MLKKTFLLSLFACLMMTVTNAQSLTVNNFSCSDVEMDFTYALQGTCKAVNSGHMLSSAFSTSTMPLTPGFGIQYINVIELFPYSSWNYVQVWSPGCGPTLAQTIPYLPCGQQYWVELTQTSPFDYALYIYP